LEVVILTKFKMKNMKRNVLLIPFVAVMTLLFFSMASALTDNDNIVSSLDTEFNGVALSSWITMAGDVSSVVPVRVTFTADADVSDVRVEVSMDGFREDIEAETNRFDIVDGHTYTKLLSLELPTNYDNLDEEYTLKVVITHKGSNAFEEYTVSMQRESYTFEVLSVDYSSNVNAGDVVPVSIVIKNTGFNRMDDTYVVVSIPALGVSTRSYVGDLISTEDYNDYDDEEDSMYRTVYLNVPTNAVSGIYDMNIEVYNNDAETSVTELINVGEVASNVVLTSTKNQDLEAGETITYDMIIVNSADSVKIFDIETISGDALIVSAPSVVTVGPDASETVQISVKVSDDADVGTYAFSVVVDGDQTVFGANVIETSVSTSIVALTVILVIIFVVLLAALVVLLTKKEKPVDEVETSYY
jgi:hypothetical protein